MSLQDIQIRDAYVAEGWLTRRNLGTLAIYNYTLQTQFAGHWDDVTRHSRGIIFDTATGECVARPFPKFFNVGERPETQLDALPLSGHHEVFEKLDGSLGILYRHEGRLCVATRGTFDSDQARWATEHLNRCHSDLYGGLDDSITLLFEIVYPENRIVVDYGGDSGLIVLGAFNRHTGAEIPPNDLEKLCDWAGLRLVPCYPAESLFTCLDAAKTLPASREGWVIRFASGLRVKVKGDEYRRISRLIQGLSPKALWEAMKDGKVPPGLLDPVPAALRQPYEAIAAALEAEHTRLSVDALSEFCATVRRIVDRRAFAEEAKKGKHTAALFALLDGKGAGTYVMKQIEPKGKPKPDAVSVAIGWGSGD